MRPAISVENLGKSYRITGGGRPAYRTLRESLASAVRAPFRRGAGRRAQEFWAVKDVSFDVPPGRVLGIIGRNGAGKSTLLKILSRITRPTAGQVTLHGRVGSLLEVGTGFHPELTGRENVYLNGAVLGMSRREIARKFDEIVAFSETEAFLDTPVKRYSSGMYVRLAFAVAAHLESEILIVDEVLAVGDIAFQKKCLGRMRAVTGSGRTVLFVSHNMAAVEALCDSALVLEKGRIAYRGEVGDAVREYYRNLEGTRDDDGTSLVEGGRVFRAATLVDEQGVPCSLHRLGETLRLRARLEAAAPIEEPTIGIAFDDVCGQRLLTVHTPLARTAIDRVSRRCEVECTIPEFPLAPGDYWVKLALAARGEQVDSVEKALRFTVVNGDVFGEGRGFHRGVCVARSDWGVRHLGDD
jgi:lipopolysaccharide transport system ATP-binding protein